MNIRSFTTILIYLSLLFVPTAASIASDLEYVPIVSNSDEIVLSEAEIKWLNKKHTVKVRVAEAPPYQIRSNPPSGIAVDYIKLIAKIHDIDIAFDISPTPWAQALEMLRDKNGLDMVLTIKPTPEREEYISFTDNYLTSPWVIFNRNQDRFVGDISSLYGQTVAVQEGYVTHEILERDYPEIKLLLKDSTENAVRAVSVKEADAFIGDLTIGSYIIQYYGYSNLKVAAPAPFGNHDQAMGIRKDWPELSSIISKTLISFSPEVHSSIFNRWLYVNYQQGMMWKDVTKWASVAGVFALVIIGIIIYWNRLLKKEINERKKNEIIVEKFFQQPMNLHLIAGIDGTIHRFNTGWNSALGYSEEELEGTNFFDFVHPDDIAITQKEMEKLSQGEITFYFENRYRHKNGKYRLFAWSAIVEEKDQLVYAVASDITEKKEFESVLKETNEQLQLRVREEVEKNNHKEKLLFEHKRFVDMGQMISAIAHQWRQPLNNISLTSQMLRDIDKGHVYSMNKADLYTQQNEIIEYMSKTIDDFRNYFSNKKEKHNFSIIDEIHSTMNLVNAQFNALAIMAHIKTEGSNNQQGKEDLFVMHGYSGEFRQVLLNILINAKDAVVDFRKNHPDEDGKIVISVGYDPVGYRVSIENTGENIPDEILTRIFQPYFTTKAEGKGTGIGLYLSRMIIENEMNGKIYAENTELGVALHLLLPKNSN
ncbi:MAG: hypothetical protein C0602_04085 [Denitrovibrio sp.]|nr:MAG: hypothetical protein C0602_04085 [Denitrovibrio sp.]